MPKLQFEKQSVVTDLSREEFYEDLLGRLIDKSLFDKQDHIDLDCDLLLGEDEEILDRIHYHPESELTYMESALNIIKPPDIENKVKLHLKNLPYRKHLNELSGDDVGRLISLDVSIRKVKQKHPKLKIGNFKCGRCTGIIRIPQFLTDLEVPVMCPNCERTGSQTTFTLLEEESEFMDCEEIYAEEPRDISENPEPYKVLVIFKEELCQQLKPGQRCIVNGIVHVIHRKDNKFDMYIEGLSYENLDERFDIITITDEDKDSILKLSKHPYVIDELTKMISPQIQGMSNIKKALLLQQFGGVEKIYNDQRVRGEGHILLIGDPGTGKTVLARYVAKISPKSVLTSGKGSTSAGLTAAAVRDELDGQWTVEAGALVLADRGINIIDEIEKMSDTDRKTIHEPMESGTVSFNKAGINVILNARCSILACANPKKGRFNREDVISEQIDLDAAIISRFDLIFPIADKINKKQDTELATKILENNRNITKAMLGDEDAKRLLARPLSVDLFRKYIAYAKQNITPVLTDDANKLLEEKYVLIREDCAKSEFEDGIPRRMAITLRQLEAQIRLTESSARARLSNIATIEDAQLAIDIWQYSMDMIGKDSDGQLSVDRIQCGVDRSKEAKVDAVFVLLCDMDIKNPNGIYKQDLIDECSETLKIDAIEVDKILKILSNKGDISEPSPGKFKPIR